MPAHVRGRAVRYLRGSAFLTAELETIDSNLEKTINGDTGGNTGTGGGWNPTARLVVGGAGMRIARNADLQNVQSLTLTNGATVTWQAPGKAISRLIPDHYGVSRPFPNPADTSGWVLTADEPGVRPVWVSMKVGSPLVLEFPVPRGLVISTLTVTLGVIVGVTHLNPPDQCSLVELIRMPRNLLVPAPEVLASTRDVFTSDAAYIASHDVVVTPVAPVVTDAANYRYAMRIHAEDGITAGGADDITAHIGQMMKCCIVAGFVTILDPHLT